MIRRIYLLGRIGIQIDREADVSLPARAQELLVYLLLHRHRSHRREALAAHLWEDASGKRAKKYLRQMLWRLQATLDEAGRWPSLLTLDGQWIGINPDAELWLDVEQFAGTFAALRDRPGEDLVGVEVERLESAVALYGGDLLPGWYQSWCLIERERYRSMLLAMIDKIVRHCLAHGRFEKGVEHALQLLRHEPGREKTHRQLMRLYYESGDRSSALRQYRQCVALLDEEFGVEPTGPTRALFEAIRDQADPAPITPLRERAAIIKELEQLRQELSWLRAEVDRLRSAL